MSDSRHPPLSSLFPFSLKDLRTTLLTLAIAVGVCILLQRLDPSAGFAMPVVLLFRRLFRDKQPIAIPFLPFLACGCSVATLAELFL